MSNTLFNRYRDLAAKAEITLGTKESMNWFAQRIRKDSKIRNLDRVTKGLRANRIFPGSMVTYVYDPKYKDKLKFYDTHPLIVVLDIAKGGWYGANVHYLPPKMRAALFYEIEYNRKSMQQIASALETNEMTKVCLKRYLFKQVKSTPITIPRDEWEIAIQLPFESFQKESIKNVWRDSRRKL